MVRAEGRYAFCGSAPGTAGICRVVEQGDPLLRRAACGEAGNYGLGTGGVQVRQHAGRCAGEAAVRPVLHQERLARPGSADYVPDHQDRAAGPGSPMRWIFWGAAFLIAYTYVGYAAWLWLRARLRPWPVLRAPQEPYISIVMVVRNEERWLESKLRNLLEMDYP